MFFLQNIFFVNFISRVLVETGEKLLENVLSNRLWFHFTAVTPTRVCLSIVNSQTYLIRLSPPLQIDLAAPQLSTQSLFLFFAFPPCGFVALCFLPTFQPALPIPFSRATLSISGHEHILPDYLGPPCQQVKFLCVRLIFFCFAILHKFSNCEFAYCKDGERMR